MVQGLSGPLDRHFGEGVKGPTLGHLYMPPKENFNVFVVPEMTIQLLMFSLLMVAELKELWQQ